MGGNVFGQDEEKVRENERSWAESEEGGAVPGQWSRSGAAGRSGTVEPFRDSGAVPGQWSRSGAREQEMREQL